MPHISLRRWFRNSLDVNKKARLQLMQLQDRIVPALNILDYDVIAIVSNVYSVTLSNGTSESLTSASFDWGDGSESVDLGAEWPGEDETFTLTHYFDDPSSATITLDPDTGTGSDEITRPIVIMPNIPPAFPCPGPMGCMTQKEYQDLMLEWWTTCYPDLKTLDPGFSRGEPGDLGGAVPLPGGRGDGPVIDPGIMARPPECPGLTGNNPNPYSEGPIRYADGVVQLNFVDLVSTGFESPWFQGRSWSNGPGYDSGSTLGDGWVTTQFPNLIQIDGLDTLALVTNGTTARYYDATVADPNVYQERFFGQSKLEYDDDEFVLTTPGGVVFRFAGFDGGRPVGERGQLIERVDLYGLTTEITRDKTSGLVSEIERGGAGYGSDITETWLYDYYDSDGLDGLLQKVTLKRHVDSDPDETIRYLEYSYYVADEAFGNLGNLKTVEEFDALDQSLGVNYFRYYQPSDEKGFSGALKTVLTAAAYDRFQAWNFNNNGNAKLEEIADSDVKVFADLYLEYDSARRASLEQVQGAGCSMCSAGIGTYEFTYESSKLDVPDGFNHWAMKTTEELPDGNQNIVYTNAYGQVMLLIQKDAGNSEWLTHFVYDGQGQVVQVANPSAATDYDDNSPTLMITDGVRLGVSPEYRVNTYTTGLQTAPNIARNWTGDYVITWASNGQDGSNLGIYAQRFNAVGQPQGSEFKVNTYTTGEQTTPVVGIDGDGDFVIVWRSNGQDGSGYGIYGQRYDAAGQTQGAEFKINGTTTGNQTNPAVAMNNEGDFVVVWESSGIYAQLYDQDGKVVVSETMVNTTTTGGATRPAVSMDADGNFVVVWSSAQDGSDQGIIGRLFNSSCSPVTSEFAINSITTNRQYDPAVAMDADGDFVVAWNTYNGGFSDSEVWARRFDSTGTAIDGSDFQVNTYTTLFQFLQSIACNADGDFLITWSSNGEDLNGFGVFGQFYLADKTTTGAFQINNYTTSNQNGQAVASDYDGNFVVTWRSNGQDGSDYGIFVRQLERNHTYVSDDTGLVTRFVYGRTTTATDKSSGDVAGRLSSTWIQNGERGTPVKQSALSYFQFTEDGITISPLASVIGYVDENATTPITTSYEYEFVTDTLQLYKMTIARPTVTDEQNGSDSPTTEEYVVDEFGRVNWIKDAGGFITYREFDDATGAVTLRIDDVYTKGAGFSDLPDGWSTENASLHLISEYENDYFGRVTKSTDPMGHISFARYDDAAQESRLYANWNTGTDSPTGPIQIYRHDRTNNYVEGFTSAVAPGLDGNDEPDGSEVFNTDPGLLLSLRRTHFNNAGQAIRSDAYFQLDDVTYSDDPILTGDKGVKRHYESFTDYAFRGWVKRTQTPNGTITRYIHDNLGRVTEVWVGTDDETDIPDTYWPDETSGTNMIQVAAYEYDNGDVGDSNLTSMTAIPGGSFDNRVTEYLYDWRNRLVMVKAGVEDVEDDAVNRPISYTVYDNLNRVTETYTYDGDDIDFEVLATVLSDLDADDRLRSKTVNDYDNRSRVFRTHVYDIDPVDGDEGRDLISNVWYDARGFVIKSAAPGGLVQKTVYNGMGWMTASYVTDGRDGANDYDEAYSAVDDVVADTVYEEALYTYDDNGNVLSVTSKQRFHDESGYGELGDSDTTPYARVSYSATWYDDFSNRVTHTANYGTYGGDSWSRPGSAPAGSDTVLVNQFTYDESGRLFSVIDPRGIESRAFYDVLGRTTKTIQNFTGTGEIDDDFTNENKTTEFVYDGSGHLIQYRAWLNEATEEVTEYIYGVEVDGDNLINSNDILSMIIYPAIYGPQPAQFSYEYNQLGQRITMEDINGTAHAYSFDIVGRPIEDSVTAFGKGVDETVARLTTEYDSAGRAFRFTSWDDEDNELNQVSREFNGFGQLLKEYQEWDGAVDGGTLYVGYDYSSSDNHSRLVTMTYPNGREIDYNYSGSDDQISRLSSMSDGSITLEGFTYLGLGTVVVRAHPQPDVDLTYIGSPADAGDQYSGLDRFGRIVDLNWYDNGESESAVHLEYGYDRDGNRLYVENLVNSSFSELYHANGEGEGYDGLNQLVAFARGTLSDSGKDGIPDTITASSRSQTWAPDALGNFSEVTTKEGKSTIIEARSHDEQNRLNEIDYGSSTSTLAFDKAGNMLTDETGRDFTYDAWNRMITVTPSEEFTYDALGRRTLGSARQRYYSQSWQVVEDHIEGVLAWTYVWSPVYVDAMIARDSYSKGSFSDRIYALQDANFNVVALTESDGDVIERYAYDPYGLFVKLDHEFNTWTSGTNHKWVYLFQGGRWEGQAGLYYFRHRDYSPTLMRWAEMDPIGFAANTSNLFQFESDNPANSSDWLGLTPYLPQWDVRAPIPGEFGDATAWVECKGRKLVPHIRKDFTKIEKKCGVEECTREHEQDHIDRALADNNGVDPCHDKPDGWVLIDRNPLTRAINEAHGYTRLLECLVRKSQKASKECKDIIKQWWEWGMQKRGEYVREVERLDPTPRGFRRETGPTVIDNGGNAIKLPDYLVPIGLPIVYMAGKAGSAAGAAGAAAGTSCKAAGGFPFYINPELLGFVGPNTLY